MLSAVCKSLPKGTYTHYIPLSQTFYVCLPLLLQRAYVLTGQGLMIIVQDRESEGIINNRKRRGFKERFRGRKRR